MKKIILVFAVVLAMAASAQAQAWSGVVSPARATNWGAYAGLPGDVPPDASWTQAGSTIAPCGANGSPVSAATCGITAALAGCGTNHFVLLGTGDFYLNTGINLPSNCVLRGGGANVTRVHFANGGTYNCSAANVLVCMGNSGFFTGYCSKTYTSAGGNVASQWPCPSASWVSGGGNTANWTAGYTQGATTITLDSVTGITTNLTPIILDQCDVGYTGSSGVEYCVSSDGGAGAITAISVAAGGTGYAVNDTFTIGCAMNFQGCYGLSPVATGKVTTVSGGVVTGVAITGSGGGGYTYTSAAVSPTIPDYVTTTHTSGSGNDGLHLYITGIAGYDNNSILECAVTMVCTYLSSANDSRSARSEQEVFTATNISGSGPYTVTLNRPLMHPDWAIR